MSSGTIKEIFDHLKINCFVIQTKKTANWLTEKMTGDGHAVALLSGELTVEQRAQVIDRFREGKEKVLITTNVSARGKAAIL